MNQHTPAHPARVAVLGLGAMGAALARTLVGAGHHVAVWNRSPKDPEELAALGLERASPATRPAGAASGADAVLVCVLDHDASRPLIDQLVGVLGGGVPVVNMTTATAEQAVESAAAAEAIGIPYVTAAIMVPTPLIGTADNLVLYAGEPAVLAVARPVLDSLGGTVDLVGEDHALPPVLDMAMLDVYFAGMYAFLHSAAMVRGRGIEPTSYLPYAAGITRTLASSLPALAEAFERRTYDGGEATLRMCLSFLNHIVATSESAGVDDRLPRLIRDATQDQADRGFADLDWDCVAEGLTR